MAGIEPATDGLRNRCSTTELHWHRPTHSAAPKIEEATEAFAGAKQSLNQPRPALTRNPVRGVSSRRTLRSAANSRPFAIVMLPEASKNLPT